MAFKLQLTPIPTHVQEVRAALQKHAAAGESGLAAGMPILLDEDLEPDQEPQKKSSGQVIDLTDSMPEAAGVKQGGPSGDPHSADNLSDQSMSAHQLFTTSITTQPSKASRYLDALDRWSPTCLCNPTMHGLHPNDASLAALRVVISCG